ncbi:MAG: phosphoribulokinase [Solirubrobacterales bacterium]|nr:phosphoribulokinase [Solirubrobacterales bacterium]
MPRPIILGVVGDSAAGKTTITRGLVRLLGEEHVTHIAADDYHRYDRKQRAERGITPLDPECNYVDIMEAHFAEVRAGRPILKPVYRHQDGTFGPPDYVTPRRFTVVEGLLGYHTSTLRDLYDVRVFLAPPEDLRRKWKVDRDCSRRGYTTDQVLEELDRREHDSASYIRPQQRFADIVVSFMPGDRSDQGHLDAQVTLRSGLVHPDLAPYIDGDDAGVMLVDAGDDQMLVVSGDIDPAYAAQIEEAVWDRMRFASHLRSERLGEFTIGTQLHRSESLALVQVIVLYHLATARASVALGGEGLRVDRAPEPATPRAPAETPAPRRA